MSVPAITVAPGVVVTENADGQAFVLSESFADRRTVELAREVLIDAHATGRTLNGAQLADRLLRLLGERPA